MKTAVKQHVYQLRTVEIALMVGLAIFLGSGVLALRTQDELADKVVRLHVLANSDSEEDQALKLKVRDEPPPFWNSPPTAGRRRAACGGSCWSWSASRRRRSPPKGIITR